jgi:DNA-binding transcriptional MerR regulator/methylmalonyl-CoA mutase cobalamin-binding subunit
LATFSIKDIESLTGIKSHTLRIWEQRFSFLKPKRTETNIRFYDDEDLKLLLNISVLNNHNVKISEIAKMTSSEMSNSIVKLSDNSSKFTSQIKDLISPMMSFDELGFHNKLNELINDIGFEETYINILLPFLVEIGMLWQIGAIQPSHEHFVTNIIKQKLFCHIDSQVANKEKCRKKFLLFLPETETHSLGLLFANYIIRSRGHDVIFLGQEVPLEDLKNAFKNESPDYIYTTATIAHLKVPVQEMINFLSENWPNSQILVSGYQFIVSDAKIPVNVKILKKANDFIDFINGISADKLRESK